MLYVRVYVILLFLQAPGGVCTDAGLHGAGADGQAAGVPEKHVT
jgi:hypothetical protein